MSGDLTERRCGARRLACLTGTLLAWLVGAHAHAQPDAGPGGVPVRAETGRDAGPGDAGTPDVSASGPGKPRRPRIEAITELLYSTTEVSRMHVRCRADKTHEPDDAAGEAGDADPPLHCAFFTLSVAQRPAEKMATFGNYVEILRDMATQCRTLRPRTEQARRACAACRKSLTDACLYVEVMRDLRQRCTTTTRPVPHPNPAVRALEQADDERGQSVTAITDRFCDACRDDMSAACFSSFWNGIEPPERCALKTASFELTLTRQSESPTWIGNLGGTCNTQVALSYDEAGRTWSYRQVQLTPEKCSAARRDEPITFSSAAQYAFSDLTVMCERVSFQ